MKDFRDLHVWRKVHLLTSASYRVTNEFPRQEMHGTCSQTTKMLRRYLNIATGSGSELESPFLLAHDLKFINENDYLDLNNGIVEGKRTLAALARRVKPERFAS